MRPTKIELISRKITKFPKSDINGSVFSEINENSDSIGGVIRKGELGWIARGPLLEVYSLRNANKISSYRFDIRFGFQRCIITCVTEIDIPNLNHCLLAVGIQFGDDPGGMVAIYSVQDAKVLRGIETDDKITACHLISADVTKRTILNMLQGCLAIGTDTGKIILLDLDLRKCELAISASNSSDDDATLVPCHVVLSTMDTEHIMQHFKHARKENVSFGIQLEVIDNGRLVLSLLSIPPLLALAVGLEEGRLILYDLTDLQAFHLAYPPEMASPLVKLSYMEPPDDPRACIYIWAFHENPQTSIAVMHSVMYDKKTIEDDDDFCIYEGFQTCSVRLTLPMYEHGSFPISCQTVAKFPSQDSDETISLCLLSWKSRKSSELLVFDINQWYKEQMPNLGDRRDNLSYLASFPLKECLPLDIWIDGRTIAPFNSIQRLEEHFFPVSLSFDCILLQQTGSINLHWPGLQNRALELLNMSGPMALLEPSVVFHEVVKASLIPQFSDYNFNSSVSITLQRETLLSVALEHNCFGLLKECAKCWADGSHLGKKPNESLSLSTLTMWIWKRAESIKGRCNVLCVSLFDHSGLRVDQRSQKQLSHCSRQLKLLADLMNIILTKCKEYIPEEVNTSLASQYNSIRMASEYQEVLQWFLNVGLLPEAKTGAKERASYINSSFELRVPLVPYPYKILRNYYMSQRMKFKKINSGLLSARTQSCRILYIDSFIEHECNSNVLRDHWLESGGNGLYPPPSLQAMLRILLVPDVPIENKYVLFVYLFLDLNMALEDERYTNVIQNLIKFPAVFKLNSSTIKIIQAFWNLDHGQYEAALEDIISPFSHERQLIQWQQELLIETLLIHQAPKLALRAIQAPGPPISSVLELKTLLANDLIAEAFHLQRSKSDPDLLRTFLTGCLYLGKLRALLDLALTEEEEKILEEFLRNAKSSKAENLHFVHLLQRAKYIEAVEQLDELSRSKHNLRSVDLETPNLVLAAYNTTMTPAIKKLSEVYYGIKNRLKAQEPEAQLLNPLSCQLLKHNANDLIGGIYHSSIMGVDEATNYWDDQLQRERTRLLYSCNVPFIRRPQLDVCTGYQIKDSISYPEIYKGAQKRRLELSVESDLLEIEPEENPKKRQKINDLSLNRKATQPLNISLLTKFKDRTVSNLNVSESSSLSNVTVIKKASQETTLNYLNTPIIKSIQPETRDNSFSESSEFSKNERVCTPQSILKVRNTSRTALSVSSPVREIEDSTIIRSQSPKAEHQNEIVDEEKSIRFDLPSANITSSSSLQTSSGESLGMSLRVPSTSVASVASEDIETKKPKQYDDPKPRKALHSADSSFLSTSAENDEFFLPHQSHDNSMKMDFEEDSDEKNYKTRIMDGPKPRPGLGRSRSRSKTPDILMSPSRKSARILEKTTLLTKSNLGQTNTETKQTNTKSLTRLVLESNNKKATLKITEASIENFDSSGVLAQSTQIIESKIIKRSPVQQPEHRKNSEISTLDGEVSFPNSYLQPSGSSSFIANKQILRDDSEVSDSFKKRWNDRQANSSLMTTMDMSSFEMTQEGLNPSENLLIDSSLEFSKIGGRKSYKTDRPEQSKVSDKDNAEDDSEGDVNEDVLNEYHSEDDDRDDSNEGNMYHSSSEQEEIVTFEEQVEEEEEEHSDESSHSVAEYDEEGVYESDTSDIINISSNESDSTEKALSTTTSTRESRSESPTEKENSDLLCVDLDHYEEGTDDNNLLYGDLDERQSPSTSHSTESEVTESYHRDTSTSDVSSNNGSDKSFLSQPTIRENYRNDEVIEANIDDASVKPKLSETVTSTMMFDSSGIGNVRSNMTMNVLTGEYENMEESEADEYFSIGELNRGRLEATSTTILEISKEGTPSREEQQFLTMATDSAVAQEGSELKSSKLEATSSTILEIPEKKKLSKEDSADKCAELETTSIRIVEISEEKKPSRKEPQFLTMIADSVMVEEDSINILELPILDKTIEGSIMPIPNVIASPPEESNPNINEVLDSTCEIPNQVYEIVSAPLDTELIVEDAINVATEVISSDIPLIIPAAEKPNVHSAVSSPKNAILENKIEPAISSEEISSKRPKSVSHSEEDMLSKERCALDNTIQQGRSLEETSIELPIVISDEEDITEKFIVPENAIEPAASTSKKQFDIHLAVSPQKQLATPPEKSTVKNTDESHSIDYQLDVSDISEHDAVGVDNKQIKEQSNKTKASVLNSVENENTTNSVRVLRSTRSRSISIDNKSKIDSPVITERLERATSAPRADIIETPKKHILRKRSNSTDNPVTPNRILTRRQSGLLDRIEEDSAFESPISTRKRVGDLTQASTAMIKRSRKYLNSRVDTPDVQSTPSSTHRKYILSEDNTQTPKAITRLSSSASKTTPKVATPKIDPKERTTKARAKKMRTPESEGSSQDANESDKSEIVISSPEDVVKYKRGVRTLFTKSSLTTGSKTTEKPIDINDEISPETSEAYSSSRRLTRYQQTVLEKSASIPKIPAVIPKKVIRRRGSKIEESPSKKDDNISETDSVISTRSKRSTTSVPDENRRTTRSTASSLKGDHDDDVSSISSTRSKRSTKSLKLKTVSSKEKHLAAITEDEKEDRTKYSSDDGDDIDSTHSGVAKEPTKKGGRSKKTQK